MVKNDGGFAFPVDREDAPKGSYYSLSRVSSDGMTLRDYFAARIAAGDAAAGEGWSIHDLYSETARQLFLTRARIYYAIADAMLEARK